jgi:dTDP-4-dehydrorhamnose reductase
MNRILITGSNGLLGQKLVELFSNSSNYNLLLTSKEENSVFAEDVFPYIQLDTTQRQNVRSVLDEFEPELIINTAAITDVDSCEKEREMAWRVNVSSVENLVYAGKLVGAQIIQLSTDYVFDGKNGPYSELDRPNPLGYYGKTKLASENILRTSGITFAIVRTMVLYGVGYNVRPNFALWLLENLSQEKPIRVVDDQIGNPTLADDVAYAILKIIELERYGIFHVAGPDLISRYDFALALCDVFHLNKKLITPVKTSMFKQPAPRPLKSGFITLKAETELDVKPAGIKQGLMIFKNQMNSNLRIYSKQKT